MSGADVQITRGARIPRDVQRAAQRVGDLTDTNREIATRMVRYARDEAPIRTGRLSQSIRVQTTTRGSLQVGASTVYAGVIHWGWPRRNIAPNHFLTRALAQARVVEVYEDDIDELLRYI